MSAFTFVAFTSLLAVNAPLPVDSSKEEQKHRQGHWKILQMDITTGDRTARLKFRAEDEAAWSIKGDQLEVAGLNFPYSKAKLRFDSASDPKHLTLILQDGSKPGPTVEATYTRDGQSIDIEIVKWPRDKDGDTVKLRLILKREKE
jgi:uncharacterized protein (TIGR03067 family)